MLMMFNLSGSVASSGTNDTIDSQRTSFADSLQPRQQFNDGARVSSAIIVAKLSLLIGFYLMFGSQTPG
jgi:hypothetical protein